MELTGKIISILDEVNGQGKNGPWRKQEFILEIPSQYPKKVCIVAWGDRIDQFGLETGQTVTASIDIESREHNGRWYTEVKAWKVEKQGAGQTSNPSEVSTRLTEGADDDLPF